MKEQQPKIQLNAKNGGTAFALLIVGHILLAFLGQLIVGAIFGTNSNFYVAICSTFSVVTLALVLIFYIFYGKNKCAAITSVHTFKWYYLFIALLLSAGMFLGLGFVNDGIARLVNIQPDTSKIPNNMPTAWHFIVSIIVFALLPAIFEELFFRGLLLNSLGGVKNILAIIFSALCFALYHKSLTQLVYPFIYGVALGFLAKTAKSVIPCVVAHFINNFAVLLFYFIRVTVNLYDPILIVIGVNALAIFGTAMFFAFKKCQKAQLIKGETQRFFLPFGAFGIILCLLVAVTSLVV